MRGRVLARGESWTDLRGGADGVEEGDADADADADD
jgi:hypothetical protein